MTSRKKTKAVSKKAPRRTQSAARKASKTGDTKRPRISVLIADDHSVVREGLVSLITRKADMTVIGEAANGREAVDLWKQHHPDVTLLDLRMPELDGVGALKEIRCGDEKARIIVLTTFDGDGFKAKDRHDGVGLRGMRERVEQMGGELEITSSHGKGTKITVLLPCNGESMS